MNVRVCMLVYDMSVASVHCAAVLAMECSWAKESRKVKVQTCYLQATTIIAGFLCDYVTAIDMHSRATGAP